MAGLRQRISNVTKPSTWVLEPEAATFAPNNKWSNKDMDVVPKHLRTWSSWDFAAYVSRPTRLFLSCYGSSLTLVRNLVVV